MPHVYEAEWMEQIVNLGFDAFKQAEEMLQLMRVITDEVMSNPSEPAFLTLGAHAREIVGFMDTQTELRKRLGQLNDMRPGAVNPTAPDTLEDMQ